MPTLIHAILILQPGVIDQMLVIPSGTRVDDIHQAVRNRLGRHKPFQIASLDVGTFEIGSDVLRAQDELPSSDFALHKDAGRPIELSERILWRASFQNAPDQISLTAPDVEKQDLQTLIERDRLVLLSLEHTGPGLYPIRRTLYSYRRDGRNLDEKGYFQIASTTPSTIPS